VEVSPGYTLAVADSSGAAEARRRASSIATRLGFDETTAGRVAIVVSEAATNLVKHGRGGEILLRPLSAGAVSGLEIIALDRGPGIARLGDALRDGFSTAGSPGTGLGAIARLSAAFDIHSAGGAGTALLARLWAHPVPAAPPSGLDVAGISVARAGEEECGDAWAVSEHRGGGGAVLVADGLGHGVQAAEAAREAVRLFRASPGLAPAAVMERLHAGLRATRGAAAAVADLDLSRGVIRYSGIGNISAVIVHDGATRSLVSHNGIVGHEARRIQEFAAPFPEGALLVLHSDGLATQWRLDAYPGLAGRHPGVVAGVLYRDFKRGRDDVTVVVARATRPVGARENAEP
jgi:anti-sigma regulatory factor (Ser/Thr protein kinase)